MWLADMFQDSRGRRFFDILTRQTGLLCDAARVLAEYVESGKAELATQVLDLEKRGDAELAQLIDEISDTFVTPLDRQDLYALGEAIDDMIDYLAGAAAEIELFGVGATPAMKAMCGILVDAALSVEAAVGAIATGPKKAHHFARQASKAENRMEDLYRASLAELFNGDDVRSMMKLREIYRHLSNSADRADAVGKLVGKIVVKTT
jgi:uncharacterized protein Yka (UPF0111/DUF47 family)